MLASKPPSGPGCRFFSMSISTAGKTSSWPTANFVIFKMAICSPRSPRPSAERAFPTTRGIGAKISLYGGAVPVEAQEMIGGGRYLSSDDAMRVFAAGSLTNEMRIEVRWRNGKRSVVDVVRANRIYEIDEAAAEVVKEAPKPELQPVFEDVSERLRHTHHEDDFDDFDRQALLPKKLSQLGPAVGWHHLDGDGSEDLIVGTRRSCP